MSRTTASHDSEAGSLDIYASHGPTTRKGLHQAAGKMVLSLRGPLWRGSDGISLVHHIMQAVHEAEAIAYAQGRADMASAIRAAIAREEAR